MSESKQQEQITSLKQFCSEFQNSLNQVFNELNWDQNSLQEVKTHKILTQINFYLS